MNDLDRSPGWDKRAVNRIANEQYGGLQGMFDTHGWEVGDRVISQIQAQRAVEEYGSVEAFVRAHEDGRAANFMLNPLAVLEQDQPQVLLTSYFGYTPWDWPCLTFHDEGRRNRIVAESKPGFLAVIYGSTSKQTAENERWKILGIYQCSHKIGPTDSFLSPLGLERKQAEEKHGYTWAYAIEAIRAWSVSPETAPNVAKFAPSSYAPEKGTPIARYGTWLTPVEARGILDLDLVPEPTFWGKEQVESVLAPAREALNPSRPGPVSQSSYMVREAEGPKHLYVLKLDGNVDHFLGKPCEGRSIIKVGFSKSPMTRCRAFNSAIPAGAFEWTILKSTSDEGLDPFQQSSAAKAGEQEMVKRLAKSASSLGGEFFLAAHPMIDEAWNAGKMTAESWKP